MNFYNPYYYSIPMNFTQPRVGLLGKLFGSAGVSIGNFLNGTQKVLNIANQTIPLVKQVRPIIGNAKTVFKVMNEFKKVNTPIRQSNININSNIDTNNIELIEDNSVIINSEEGPTFFI